MYRKNSFAPFIFFLLAATRLAAQTDSLRQPTWLERSEFEVFGVINYYNFDWQTDSVRRNAIDNERLVIEYSYNRTDRLRFNTEIEFEHGGTGVSVEFDRFEEFGEFEFDISKGGEVWVEQMNLEFSQGEPLGFIVGRFRVPIGLAFEREEPTDYPTATFSEAEAAILPNNWTETGLALTGRIGNGYRNLRYQLALVNGLDNSAFNSANWIKRGNQRRFELINAQSFALCARTDFYDDKGNLAGISAYFGNTTGNRPKPDLQTEAPLLLLDFHWMWRYKNLFFNGLALWGSLSDSEAVTNANRNLSNNLNVKRTPVGAVALAGFAEIGADIWKHPSVFQPSEEASLSAYLRADYYDTMFKTEGQVFNNPRWERRSATLGFVYEALYNVQLKMQYTLRKVGAAAPTSVNGGTLEKTFVVGMAFEFP
ncbi:MAG: autotransporter outer membrane beta-barrel domain-containing protein [Bacteroidota bacterium]